MLKYLVVAGTSLVLAGCGAVHFDVPEGQRVKLLTADDVASVRVEQKIWYALWGGKPLTENHTAPFIAANRLAAVKMYSQQSLSDGAINMVTVILSFSRRTLVIEGNPAPEVQP